MSETSRIAGDAALACAFSIIQHIRHALRDEELEAVFEDICEPVKGAIQAAMAAQEHDGR